MKTANGLLAYDPGKHAIWSSLLELAAREVFELMLGCVLTVPTVPSQEPLDVTAMVGLSGQLCGVLNVRCSAKSSAIMAAKMLGVTPDQVGPEMYDAFGEICNMIAGNFKNKISGLGDGCILSVPRVITGNDSTLCSLVDSSALEVRLSFEGMPVVVSLQVRN